MSPPIRFLVVLVVGWTGARTAWLLSDWSGVPARAAHILASPAEAAPLLLRAAGTQPSVPFRMGIPLARPLLVVAAVVPPPAADPVPPTPPAPYPVPRPARAIDRSTVPVDAVVAAPLAVAGLLTVAAPDPARRSDRWSASGYVFVRDGSGAGLSPGGMLGGSQAAGRIDFALTPGSATPAAIVARVNSPLSDRHGAEAAIGVEWRPLAKLPVSVAVERRIAIGRDGRDAWSLRAAGGVDARPLPGGLVLDAYAQAGVVGARRRDLFADGAARIGRHVDLADGLSLALGGGVWGAAQPRVERLDVGPQAVLRLARVAVALDYRIRIAGDARPGSGVALTVSTDF